MTITFTNLVGTRENLDKTIRALLENNWTAGNITGTITPIFESDTEEPDQLAEPDDSNLNVIMIRLFSRDRYEIDNLDFNGNYKHAWATKLVVTVRGESLLVMSQMEDEVNRILWDNEPNGATRLNKSDSTASEVAFFEDAEITFLRVDPEADIDYTPTSEGELVLVYYKIRS